MFALSILLLFFTPSADPADFFVPPSFDRFAHRHLEDDIRIDEIDKIWTVYENKRDIYRENRKVQKENFLSGLSDINLSGEQLNDQISEYSRELDEYQKACIQFRLEMVDHISEIKWAEYLAELEEHAGKQADNENEIISDLEEAMQEFMDNLIPSLPIPTQAPLKVHVRQFRNDVLEQYREYRRFDLHSHPILRQQYASEKQLHKVTSLANKHSTGVWYEYLELRERLKETLTADQWVAVTEPMDKLSSKLIKLSLENF
jgi:hypothetical protein